jgi:hypothetical protein
MKNKYTVQISLAFLFIASQSGVFAAHNSTNRLSVSARFGYNIKADFNYGVAPVGSPPAGYNDAAQVVGNEILMSQTLTAGSSGDRKMDGSTPFVGAELTYSREMEVDTAEKWHFGFDIAASFLPLEFKDRSQFSATEITTTDAYGFAGGIPPGASYEGTFNGPGFLLNDTPSSSSTSLAPGATVNGFSELDGMLWGLRIGPYLEFPVGENFALHCSGGLSLGWLDVDVDWRTDGPSPSSGSKSNSKTLSGAFLGADILWFFAESWSLTAGAEFEYLNDWEGSFGEHTIELDFTRSLYATLGIARDF